MALGPEHVCSRTNAARAVRYIGVTNNVWRRLGQHFQNRGTPATFAGRYFCYNLVYVEQYPDITAAIAREKELKGWTRAKKNALIAMVNPGWEFLVP